METTSTHLGKSVAFHHQQQQQQRSSSSSQALAIASAAAADDDDNNELLFLPPGFRFHPTDEEIILFYLREKVMDNEFVAQAIGEVDLNKCEPWDLPKKAKMGENKEWWFFCQRDRKYPTGMRTNRATESGYWKATGKDKEIFKGKGNNLIGMKKTLVFYKGRAPKGEKSNWVMHEYRLEGQFSYNFSHRTTRDEWVVCRVFHKSTGVRGMLPIMENNINSFVDDLIVHHSPSNTTTTTTTTTTLPPLTEFSSPEFLDNQKHCHDQDHDHEFKTRPIISSSPYNNYNYHYFPNSHYSKMLLRPHNSYQILDDPDYKTGLDLGYGSSDPGSGSIFHIPDPPASTACDYGSTDNVLLYSDFLAGGDDVAPKEPLVKMERSNNTSGSQETGLSSEVVAAVTKTTSKHHIDGVEGMDGLDRYTFWDY